MAREGVQPILYLCAAASDGLTGARIAATGFEEWLRGHGRDERNGKD